MAADTGHLWLRESLWPHFLVDESRSILEAHDGTWGLDVPVIGDFNTPMQVKVKTSSSVNRSRSPAVLGNSVSVLANGPTGKNGASPPDQGLWYGAAWLRGK